MKNYDKTKANYDNTFKHMKAKQKNQNLTSWTKECFESKDLSLDFCCAAVSFSPHLLFHVCSTQTTLPSATQNVDKL